MPAMADVARLAGVSLKTVSRVVNESPEVTDRTRTRVLVAMRELGYRPNAVARTLVTRRSYMVGVAIPDISNPYFSELVRAVQDTTAQAGYSVLVSNSDEDPEKEAGYLQHLQSRQIDGVLLCSPRVSDDRIRDLAASGTAVVAINRSLPDTRVGTVNIDEADGVRDLMRHLFARGKTRIGMLGGPALSRSATIKLAAYREALGEGGQPMDAAWVERIDWRVPVHGEFQPAIHAGYDAMNALLDRVGRPLEAVLSYNDLVAIGAIEACRERGVRVPDDIEVAGFDDIWPARYTSPPLTTVNVSLYEVGRQAAQALLGMLRAPGVPGPTLRIRPQVVFRESLRETG